MNGMKKVLGCWRSTKDLEKNSKDIVTQNRDFE